MNNKYQQEKFEQYSEQMGYGDFEEGEPDDDGRARYRNPNTQGRWNFWVASRDALSTPLASNAGAEPQCIVRMADGAREPEFVSWNAFPVGTHMLYATPPAAIPRVTAAMVEQQQQIAAEAESIGKNLGAIRDRLAAIPAAPSDATGLAAAARRLEEACNQRAALLTREAYLAAEGIAGMREVLDELDSARKDVRVALTQPTTVQQAEPEGWREALQFYADRSHFNIADDEAWDTVSGEPQNFWCDEAGTATVEDGTVAAMALRGTPLPDEDEPKTAPTAAPGDAG